MKLEFAERVAIVTGGGRGIGAAYSEGFADRGAAVVVADIEGDLAESTARRIAQKGTQIIGVQVDVADEKSVVSLFELATNTFGRVDFLVNNAAIMLGLEVPFKPFWETSIEEWHRVMSVNAGGVFLCCKHAKPIMESLGGGRIVNISSDAIWKGYESQLAYFASKGAVAVMTRNLARELGPFEINVNHVAPGYTASEAVRESSFMRKVAPRIIESQCIRREQQPVDVVGTVLFLCGPESRCITGQSFVVNLGAVMP